MRINDIGGYCRLFEGVEAEGIFKGLWTLFVSGNVPLSEINNALDNSDQYNQLYFGADRLSKINWTTVIQCLDKPLIITVEIGADKLPLNLKAARQVYIVFKINNLSEQQISTTMSDLETIKHRVQIKFDSQFGSYLMPLAMLRYNSYLDLSKDKELWRQE